MSAIGWPARTWSLRREWSRAFTIMVLILLTAAGVTILGVRSVVDEVQTTALRLHRESVIVTSLQTALTDHEQIAHQLLSNKPADRSAFLHQQMLISAQFDQAIRVFPDSGGMRTTLVTAARSWQSGLRTYGLWGDQALVMHGDHSAENPTFGAASDDTQALLDGLDGPSLDAMDTGLSHGRALEHILLIALSALFGLALAATAYFRARMTRDLTRPVSRLHQGVAKLQRGEYDQRIEVARRDELGELAEAFNAMAAALHESHQALTLRATHDSLTGLANRATLTERLNASFNIGDDPGSEQESLLFIDIDDFKNVNDSLGHEGGDALLVQLAARLNASVRPGDLVARLGGDEFAIIVVEDETTTVAVKVAERILEALCIPFSLAGTRLNVAVSIGVARRQPETSDAVELLRQADFAMYMAKGGGKNRYQLFDPSMRDHIVDASALKADLMLAVAAGQFHLEYRPVADLETGLILGVEAVVRWQHPTLGVLQPAEFIPLAGQTGVIEAIGCWALQAAADQVADWHATVPGRADLWISVNLSTFHLPNSANLAAIESILADPLHRSDMIVLEVTEAAVSADVEGAVAILNLFKGFGARIAIDDFGTGLSSLSSLARLPADIIKIDRSLVCGISSDGPSVPMLEGILGLANRLPVTVIAEGIETAEQLNLLRSLGYHMGQGDHVGRPTRASAIKALLAETRRNQIGISQ